MWVDDEGTVHTVMNPDPFQEVPEVVATTLQRHLLTTDGETLFDRYQAVEALLGRWDEEFFEQLADHLDELDTAPADAEDLLDDEEDLDEEDLDNEDAEALLPDDLVRVLEEHVHAAPFNQRLELLHHVDHIVSGWEELYLDHEKALGHLLLAHAADPELREREHEELLELHAGLHAEGGPGHGPEW